MMVKALKAIWDHEEKRFLGRKGRGWAEICTFFIVFYALLLSFFCGMLSFMYQTINHHKPTLTGDKGFLTEPGLGMRPLVLTASEKDYTSLIFFTDDIKDKRTKMCVDSLKEALKPYKKANEINYVHYWKQCDKEVVVDDTQPCIVSYDELATQECNEENNFGYTEGMPCVLVRVNKVYDWKPEPYTAVDDSMSDDLKEAVKEYYAIGTQNTGDRVWLDCYGESDLDKFILGKSTAYIPQRGFPVAYYPYTNQDHYLQPAVFVKFREIRPNLVAKVNCRIYSKNVEYDRLEWKGGFHFELLYKTV